jgi:alpha-1,3-rhamnosyltransferase
MIDCQKPLVSVLIPAYNHDRYVKETILSVINQTYGYENIQLIVADDCSTDNTAKILLEMAGDYNFKLIIHKQNMGLPSTLNEMISISKGKYITSIASDDIMILDRIENQINILNRYPEIDLLAGDSILIDENGKQIYRYKRNFHLILINYYFEDFFLLSHKSGFAAGTIIFKTELIRRIGAYEAEYKIEDFYFQLKASYNKAKIVKCNVPFAYYRLHHKSFSSNTELMSLEVSKILSIYKDHPKYSKAIQNREINAMSKWVFSNKKAVIKQLSKKPILLFNKKIIRVILMVLLPSCVLKRRYPQYYFRYAVT